MGTDRNVLNYIEQGGARNVIGGSLDVVPGGEIDIEVGGSLKKAGVAIEDAAETLTNKTLTSPALSNPALTFAIGAHDYAGAAVDWALSAAELLKTVHKPTNANGPCNAIIAAAAGKPYIFINGTGQALTVKTPAGTGVAITNGKSAIVMSDGTNVIALATESA